MIKYQGKSIVGLAHERGANKHTAKKSTAWQYLVEHIRINDTHIHHRGNRYYAGNGYGRRQAMGGWASPIRSRADYVRDKWLAKIERTGAALCHAHGYLLRTEIEGELLPHHIAYRDKMIELIAKSLKNTYSFSALPQSPQDWNDPDYYLCIAGRTIILRRTDSASWDNSGSRWPSSTSVTRAAYLMREGWDDLNKDGLLRNAKYIDNILCIWSNGEGLPERKINYEARGNWSLKIISELLGIAPKRQRGLAHVQLDPHYRVSRTRKIAGIAIYQRTLAGEIIDYCAVRGKDTYHAVSPREAVHGLAAKLATPGSRREILDMDYALSLGFCRTGVEQFCDDYKLDCSASYTRAEIQAVVDRGNGKAEKYERELAKAGIEI